MQHDKATPTDSTTGLTTRTASILAYLGWWVTGLIFWGIERQDQLVRFHAIQSTVAFGALAFVVAVATLLGLLMLSYAPVGFTIFLAIALTAWVTGLVLWGLALWKASQGERWRIPLACRIADKAQAANATRGTMRDA